MVRNASTAAAPKTAVPASSAPLLSLNDFRDLMNHVNAECRGIGCGYIRRSCRTDKVAAWLRTWASGNKQRLALLPRLRRELTQQLPDYFRDFSENDNTIENEDEFRKVHDRIAAALS